MKMHSKNYKNGFSDTKNVFGDQEQIRCIRKLPINIWGLKNHFVQNSTHPKLIATNRRN